MGSQGCRSQTRVCGCQEEPAGSPKSPGNNWCIQKAHNCMTLWEGGTEGACGDTSAGAGPVCSLCGQWGLCCPRNLPDCMCGHRELLSPPPAPGDSLGGADTPGPGGRPWSGRCHLHHTHFCCPACPATLWGHHHWEGQRACTHTHSLPLLPALWPRCAEPPHNNGAFKAVPVDTRQPSRAARWELDLNLIYL